MRPSIHTLRPSVRDEGGPPAGGAPDLGFFVEHGYQVLRGLVDRSAIDDVGDFLGRSVTAAVEQAAGELGLASAEAVPAAAASLDVSRVQGLSHDARQALCGHFPLATRLSRDLWRIPELPSV